MIDLVWYGGIVWLYDRRSVVRSSDVKRLDGDSEARGGRMDTVTH